MRVLIWSEKIVENRIGEWVGPYTVRSFDEQSHIVLVQKNADYPLERYNTTQVKPFLRPPAAFCHFLNSIHHAISEFTNERRYIDSFMTEVIKDNEPQAKSPEMIRIISSEVRDLLKRGTFKVLLQEELPDGANVLTARFVLAIKSNADNKVKYKARYGVGATGTDSNHFWSTVLNRSKRLPPAYCSL